MVGGTLRGGRSVCVCGWRWMAGWDGRLGVRLAAEKQHSARAAQVAKQIAFGLNPMDTTALRGFEPSSRTLGYEDVFALPTPTKLFADGSTLSDIDVCARNPSLLFTFREIRAASLAVHELPLHPRSAWSHDLPHRSAGSAG